MKCTSSRRILSTLLVLLMLAGCLPFSALAAGTEGAAWGADEGSEMLVQNGQQKNSETGNLALGRPVLASESGDGTAPETAVDGKYDKQWASGDMKPSGAVEDTAEQAAQWLQVDLGEGTHDISSIKLYYNMKVWPMVYEIQTSPTGGADAEDWRTVVRVERASFDGAVKNADGQNVADETGNTNPATAANVDVITAENVPGLQITTVDRYVRFYCEKVNAKAPGVNVNLKEIEIYGPVAPDEEAPSTPAGLSAEPTSDGAVLTWSPATDNVGVTGYKVYVGDESDPRGTPTAETFTLTGLASETEYTAKVIACDGAGNESEPATISFTTEAAPQITWDVEFRDDFEDGIDPSWTAKYPTAETSEDQDHTTGTGKSFSAGAEQTALVWSNEDVLHGVISVWYYDTMQTTSGVTLHVAFVESSDAPGKMAGIGINSKQNKGQYMMRYPGAGNYRTTGVARTAGWHEFKWDCSDGQSLKMYIDGKLINTATDITSFNKLTFGDDWTNPQGVAPGYYDDISIQGNVYVPPVDAGSEMDKITALPAIGEADTQIPLPEVAEGYTLKVVGSELEQIVSNDGTILGTNIGQRRVTLLLELSSDTDPEDTARKNIDVTIPDHSGSAAYEGTGWFDSCGANAKPGIVPSVQEWFGYDGEFTLTDGSKIVINDAADLGLSKVADHMAEAVEEISGVTLAVVSGNETTAGAHDIYIESQVEDVYQTGKEGYVLVTDESGLKIYSSTYTGCLYGTISAEQMLWLAEDNLSVPMGVIRDFPAYEVRGAFLDIARTDYRLDLLYDYSEIMLWYKMNELHAHLADNRSVKDGNANSHPEDYEGFHRLESKEFPSLKPETKKSASIDHTATEYFEQVYEVPYYTQEEWKDFQKHSEDLGVYVLNELDMPGHSLAYNRYAEENPDNIDWLEGGTGNATEKELLDLIGPNAQRALKFAETLWDEYTRGDDPVFQGDIVHIGADEYWDRDGQGKTAEAFVNFAETIRKTVVDNGKSDKVRIWASFGRMQIPAETLAELAPYYQIDMWSTGNDDPVARSAQGFEIVNCVDAYMYGNPGRDRRDIVNAEYVYDNWDPTVFGGSSNLMAGDPNLLGGKTALWGDESQEGMIELDIHQRIMRAIPVTSEKTWGGTAEDESFTEFELRANELAEGPGTQIAMDTESKSALVAHYDFSNVSEDGGTVYDISGNGYDAALTGGTVSDGWLTFSGSDLMETPLKTIPYPFTLSFDVKLTQTDIDANAATYGDGDATNDANLFSGYDGRLQPAGYNGNLSGDVNYFTRDFKYQLPADQEVNITLVGTMHGTKLYVDGKLETFVSQKQSNQASYPPNSMQNVFSSFVLPLEQIGENLHGSLADIRVYNKALSAEEVAAEAGLAEEDALVNVAQGNGATSYQGVGQDQPVNRLYYAAKAVDGDGFDFTNPADEGDSNKNSELNSCWYGFKADSYLIVDLGQERRVDQVLIQWKGSNYAQKYQIQTSLDGENWDEVYNGTDADRDENGVSHGAFDQPVSARYVKFQGVQFKGSRYDIQEFLVCQQVDKTELTQLLPDAEEAAAERGLGPDSTGDDKAAYDALVFARAMADSPLATYEDVQNAIEGLDSLGVESSNSGLQYISVNGKTITGFLPEETEYTFTIMPPETDRVPEVEAVPNRRDAKVDVSGLGELPCQVTITVTAPDGVSQTVYTLNLEKGQYRTVGYCFGTYGDDNAFWDVDPTKLTHLVYAFGQIYHDEKVNGDYRPGGTVVPEDQPELLGTLALSDAVRSDLSHMAELKEQNPELKIMLSVGGGTCPGWADATVDADARAKLIASCVAAVEEFQLDGIDLDWEFPGHGNAIDHNPNDKANFEALIREMRAALGEDKILTIAASSKDFYLTTCCDLPSVIDELDFVNVMSYTMTTYPNCYHNSALYPSEKFPAVNVPLESCDQVMRYYTDAGIAPEKLNVGTAFFSKIPPVAGNKLNVETLKAELGISGITMNYQQLLEKVLNNPDTKFVRQWDEAAKVPYMTYPDSNGVPQFAITYEDPESLSYKAQFIQQNQYGGAVIWQLRQDYDYILQTALSDALNGKEDVTVTFDSQGGSPVGAIHAKKGSTILKPEDPTRSGYSFAGWYRDAQYTSQWDFQNDVVEGDMTLYAKWQANGSGSGSGSVSSYVITVEKADNGAVSASQTRATKGTTVTLTVKPDAGYVLKTLAATDKNGGEVKLTRKDDSRYTFVMPASNVTVTATFAKDDRPVDTGLPFVDVDTGDWFYEAVKHAYDSGLMEGTSDTVFAPGMTTNRAMVVTLLWRLEGSPAAKNAAGFDDVADGAWYTEAVRWAAAEGIVKGYSDTMFAPNDTVTREQLATILYRYAAYKGYDVSEKGDLTAFVDGEKTSSWAAEAAEWAVGAGLLSGKGGNVLDPTGTATRAEVAQLFLNFSQSMGK